MRALKIALASIGALVALVVAIMMFGAVQHHFQRFTIADASRAQVFHVPHSWMWAPYLRMEVEGVLNGGAKLTVSETKPEGKATIQELGPGKVDAHFTHSNSGDVACDVRFDPSPGTSGRVVIKYFWDMP